MVRQIRAARGADPARRRDVSSEGRVVRNVFEGGSMSALIRRACAAAALVLIARSAASAASGDPALKARLFRAYAGVKSYKLTVLGSVRSLGVWVAPNKYQMTTEFEGKSVKTLIVGKDYWTLANGRWERSGTASNNLDVDIAGLLRIAKSDPASAFVRLPDQTQDGKRVGTFSFAFKNGTVETCNFDTSTYRVTRCKADELTLLYSGYNDPGNAVATPK
jgi:hypothetical protein